MAKRERLIVPFREVANQRTQILSAMQRLNAGIAPCAIGVVAHNHIDRHPIAIGVINGHGCVLQTDVAMDQRHHRLAFDLGVPVGHGDGRLFVAAGQKLGHFVVAIVDERLMQRFVGGARIGGQVVDIERLDDVHHVVRSRMLDDPRRFGGASAGFARQCHLRRRRGRAIGPSTLGCWPILPARLLRACKLRLRDQRGRARGGAFQKTATVN